MSFGAFDTAVSGLRAHNSWLEVIGNNLANMNTPGFKRSRAHFATLLEMSPEATCGGKQLAAGTRLVATPRVFTQGPLTQTSRPLDVALQGDGFFALKVGDEEVYTRDGAFDFDKNGILRHIASGGEILDKGGRPVQVPMDLVLPPEATRRIQVVGNLDASASGPAREVLASPALTTAAGAVASSGTLLNELGANTVPYADGDTIAVSGRDQDGSLRSAVFVYGAGQQGTTVGDLVQFVNQTFSGATATLENGHLVFTADTEGAADLELTLEDGLTRADGTAQVGASNFSPYTLQETRAGTSPATFTNTVEIFDPKGQAHQLNLTFTKASDDTWNLDASLAGATFSDHQVTGIRFNPDGSFSGVAGTGNGDSNLSFQLPGGTALTLDLDFGQPGGFKGTTQFSGFSDANALQEGGSPPGYVDRIGFDSQGHVVVAFSNGQEQQVAQLKVVKFPNPEGLIASANNLYRRTPESGDPVQGVLNTGATSVVQHYLEGSNVEQTQELTDMILAQNGFAANARSISVSQQLFDLVSSLIR